MSIFVNEKKVIPVRKTIAKDSDMFELMETIGREKVRGLMDDCSVHLSSEFKVKMFIYSNGSVSFRLYNYVYDEYDFSCNAVSGEWDCMPVVKF